MSQKPHQSAEDAGDEISGFPLAIPALLVVMLLAAVAVRPVHFGSVVLASLVSSRTRVGWHARIYVIQAKERFFSQQGGW